MKDSMKSKKEERFFSVSVRGNNAKKTRCRSGLFFNIHARALKESEITPEIMDDPELAVVEISGDHPLVTERAWENSRYLVRYRGGVQRDAFGAEILSRARLREQVIDGRGVWMKYSEISEEMKNHPLLEVISEEQYNRMQAAQKKQD